jgi:hypothetical protein
MAYISAEDVRHIRNALKKAYPNLKFSVRKSHHTAVDVAIIKGDIDFTPLFEDGMSASAAKRKNVSINQYYPENYGEFTDLFKNIVTIMKNAAPNNKWFDKSDAMTDYFHTAYYMSLEVGRWDKPYEYTGS